MHQLQRNGKFDSLIGNKFNRQRNVRRTKKISCTKRIHRYLKKLCFVRKRFRLFRAKPKRQALCRRVTMGNIRPHSERVRRLIQYDL